MSVFRTDPGECIVCGEAHCACIADCGSSIVVPQLGNTPAASIAVPQPSPATAAAPIAAEIVQATLPPGQFTTGTYRGKKAKGVNR